MKNNENMTVAEFKASIAELGLSVNQASRVLGKTPRAMQRWSESGFVKDPAVVVILRMAELLQGEPHHLSKRDVVELLHIAAGVPYIAKETPIDEQRAQQIKKLQSIVSKLDQSLLEK